jgi:RNA-directed DNA polymerase
MQSLRSANGPKRRTEWQAIPWRKAFRLVRNLRQRIFRASSKGEHKKVRSLQKLMLRSYSNILLSVRRVTQVNKGKNTPGVDKMVVKTPSARGQLTDQLSTFTPWQAKPARRVYIPKSNGKQRPLGIPVVIDRCLQAMVKNALEPEWEAKFEGSSYGFRPGRSCHDAIERIFKFACANKRKKWVLDADIKGAFDNINQAFLLNMLGQFSSRELIKQWLKAGYVEAGHLHSTQTGTPQGGVISPLLLNIALHGMEVALGVKYKKRQQGEAVISNRAVVRYADDFVVFCETQEDALICADILMKWLQERGLSLSAEKTRVAHLSEGFDFLGFNIRQYKSANSRTGWKLFIKPSENSVKKLQEKLKAHWLSMLGKNVCAVVETLNPIIRGWANYFRIAVSSEMFSKLDKWMFIREVRFVKRSHPNKPRKWQESNYWGHLNLNRKDRWVFGDKETGAYLLKFRWFPIERHVLVKGKSSPDDPSQREYWAKRKALPAKDLTPSYQKLARKQGYVCPRCGESLWNGEELHRHHVLPKTKGGKSTYANLSLVHVFCHQQIHSSKQAPASEDPDWKDSRKSILVKDQTHMVEKGLKRLTDEEWIKKWSK